MSKILHAVLIIMLLAGLARAQSTAPAISDKTQTKFDAIEREIQRREKTNPRSAEVLAKDLQAIRDQLAGKQPAAAPDAGPQLHVVGMYGPKHWRTNEIVQVTATDRPVILVLCAYDPVRWEITLAEGAKLQRVILAGYHEPKLTWTDPAKAVQVETHVHELKGGDYFYAFDKRSADYQKAAITLKQLTGLEVTTFQGASRGNGGPYIVGADSPAWFAQVIDDQLEPLYREATAIERALPANETTGQTFKAIYFNPDPPPPRIMPNGRQLPAAPLHVTLLPRVLADFTTHGPIHDSYVALAERLNQVAFDPGDAASCYALSDHDVFRVNLATGKCEKMPVKGDVPKLSWPSGVAFDTKRNRLVVHAREHNVAYSPEKNEWTYIAESPEPRTMFNGLVYSADGDCFYSLSQSFDGQMGKIKISTLTPDCAVVSSVEMQASLPEARIPSGGRQLVMMGKNIVILTTPVEDGNGQIVGQGHCLVADPTTGKVVSDRVLAPRAATAADFAASEVSRLWRLLGSEDTAEAKQAGDRLIAGGDRAVAELTPRIAGANRDNVPQLIDALANPDLQERERATSDLAQLGPSIEPQLRKALEGQITPEARTRLEAILRDSSAAAQSRREARLIQILQDIATPTAVERLIELSVTKDEARQALRRI